MAQMDDQEKTEEPTAKRLEKSREEGQIARSKELTSALILLTGSLLLRAMAGPFGSVMSSVLSYNLSLEHADIFDPSAMSAHLLVTLSLVTPIVLMVLGGLFLAGVIGQIAVGGWLFTGKNLTPKLSRFNPAQWPKKVFSANGAMELLKSILKVMLVAGCLVFLLYENYAQLVNLGRMPLHGAIAMGLNVFATAMLYYALVMVFISMIDAPFQLWNHKQRLMMSRQEIKDEHKQMEGSPEVKSRIRRLQREMANQRMMLKVPEANVVIVNPTHYSVALKYDPERSSAPFVVAKGADEIAFRIRESADSHDVQIVETPLLTRAIFYSTKIDQEIPGDLYLAVAQVLAYVHQLQQFRQGRARKAPVLPDIDVPTSYQKQADRH